VEVFGRSYLATVVAQITAHEDECVWICGCAC
jgi:hypothetical protein